MPRKDTTGPPKKSTGPRDGRGKGEGTYAKPEKNKGVGSKEGGKKGSCK